MNNKLLAVGAVAIVAGAVLYSQNKASVDVDLPELAYVPADTAVFYGQLKPFPYSKYFALMPDAMKGTNDFTPIIAELKQTSDPNAVFLASLMEKYQQSLSSYDAFKSMWGFGDDYKGMMYAQGLMPIVRFEVADQSSIINSIKQSADEAGIAYTSETLDGVGYTRFNISLEGLDNIDLIASTHNNWATLTLATPLSNNQDLRIALGIEKPAKSLADIKKLPELISTFSLDGNSVGYVDHQHIANAITGKEDSRLHQMLTELLNKAQQANAFDAISTPECQADIAYIAQKWPATVSGTTKSRITADYADFDVKAVLQSTDQDLLNTLQAVRGFVPKHTTQLDGQMLSVAYGIDVAKVLPLANTLTGALKSAEFKCGPIVALQNEMRDVSTAGLAMVSGFANGVQGMSLSVQDAKFTLDDTQGPQVESLDALVTLSATDAHGLYSIAQGFVPPLANIKLPANGDAVVINEYIPSPVPLNFDIKMAMKGNHIVIFTGDQSARIANELDAQSVTKNGFVNMAFDIQKILLPLLDTIAATGQLTNEEMAELEALRDQPVGVYFATDITDNGIGLESNVQITKK
ncbi:hypothetical protein [Pseudoalteromonas sp. bablab_jr011]|uniref:hypothetical protein n=1 Tax=Pseudoalteromonas sp. bablab_jr011 TaxID=2755062 RepID=UPI0018F3969C|nr:hypothetical protein [Pseudoalteromonas sp. bablab_jr011]